MINIKEKENSTAIAIIVANGVIVKHTAHTLKMDIFNKCSVLTPLQG